jgi:hypothetical protein
MTGRKFSIVIAGLLAATAGVAPAQDAQTEAVQPSFKTQKTLELKVDEPDAAPAGGGDVVESSKLPAVQEDKLPAVQKDKLPAVQGDKLPAVQKDKLPAVQSDKLPAVQDKAPAGLKEQVTPQLKEQVAPELEAPLPSTPKNLEAAAGEPEITRLSRTRAQQGHRVRIEGRFFGPEADERTAFVRTRADDGVLRVTPLDIRQWHNDHIVAVIPSAARPGRGVIGIGGSDGRTLTQASFEVLAAGGSLGTAGADIGDADVVGDASSGGGFTREAAEELRETLDAPELFIGDIDWEREIWRTYGLYYGYREGVQITVRNVGDRGVEFRGAYQIERQAPDTTGVMRIGPGEEKRVSMQVDLTPSLSPAAKKKIGREHEVSIRFFVADPSNPSNLYRDGDMGNHDVVKDVSVRSELEVIVDLDRIRQHGLCENFAEERDWMFMIFTDDGGYFTYDLDEEDRPAPLGDGRIRSESAISPPVRYSLEADHKVDISTNPWLAALKNNGRIKNFGRMAEFPISENVDDLFARGGVTRWIRSSDRGGSFCGSNLEVRANLEARIRPHEG